MRNLIYTCAIISIFMSCQKDNLPAEQGITIENNQESQTSIELETRGNDHSIQGKVWEDLDGDGIQDFKENGLEGVTLLLMNNIDNITIQEYVTNESGTYFFDIEDEGDYYIEIVLENTLSDYVATIDHTSSHNSFEQLDSDVTHEFGPNTSSSFTHDYNDKFDFGFYKSGAIGNQVWVDSEFQFGIRNIIDGGDIGLEGCILKLYTIDLMTGITTLIDTTISNTDGKYLFDHLKSGYYFIEIEVNEDDVTPQRSYSFVPARVGNDSARDSDIVEVVSSNNNRLVGRTSFISLEPSEISLETDIGLRLSYYHHVPSWYTGGIGSTTSGPKGTVYKDSNADGLLTDDEPKMANVTINLINTANDSIVESIVTDANGDYQFQRITTRISNLHLSLLQPQGYMLTKNVESHDHNISNFDQKTRKTIEFKTAGCPHYTFNAGLVEGIVILGRKG